MEFGWDHNEAEKNKRKHKISFVEAATAFGDPLSVTAPDPHHSEHENRYLTVGISSLLRPLIIAHTIRNERIRIISARELTRREKKIYEEEIEKGQ